MADSEQQGGAEFAIQKIYTKDISFETPNSPDIFKQQWQPQINVDLNTNGTTLEDSVYEVVLSLTVTAKLEEKTAFLVEIQQAGIFTIKGISETALPVMLGSFCPNILFPYARERLADFVRRHAAESEVAAPLASWGGELQPHLCRAATVCWAFCVKQHPVTIPLLPIFVL